MFRLHPGRVRVPRAAEARSGLQGYDGPMKKLLILGLLIALGVVAAKRLRDA